MKPLTKKQLAVRAKWTTALRSGAYQQVQHLLRKGGGFCCLGVLCDVLGAPTGGNYPDPATTKAAAIGTNTDDLGEGLWWMNDNAGDDFATIADAIDLDTLMRQDGCL